MKIIKKALSFKDLEIGDLFMWEDELYLKIGLFTFPVDEKQPYNAVHLNSGEIISFEDDDLIVLKDGEITIY